MMHTIRTTCVLWNKKATNLGNDRPNLEDALKRRTDSGELILEEGVIQSIGTRCMRVGFGNKSAPMPISESEFKYLQEYDIGKGHVVYVYHRQNEEKVDWRECVAVCIHDENFCRY